MARILIVEDEPDLREMLATSLRDDDFAVTGAPDVRSAWDALINQPPDLVLLDWMLPDITGIQLLRRIRNHRKLGNIPVIILTARAEESDRIHGLDSGADDYVVKPFSLKELRARVRAQLRRKDGSDAQELLEHAGVQLDVAAHRVRVDNQPLDLGPTEFRLLHFLMSRPDRVFSRTQLLDSVWGTEAYVEERTVDVHIARLRKALESADKAHHIQTVRGAGYRFSAE